LSLQPSVPNATFLSLKSILVLQADKNTDLFGIILNREVGNSEIRQFDDSTIRQFDKSTVEACAKDHKNRNWKTSLFEECSIVSKSKIENRKSKAGRLPALQGSFFRPSAD
jgi:hypothetical protein